MGAALSVADGVPEKDGLRLVDSVREAVAAAELLALALRAELCVSDTVRVPDTAGVPLPLLVITLVEVPLLLRIGVPDEVADDDPVEVFEAQALAEEVDVALPV